MKKIILQIICMLMLGTSITAQNFGNEWIDFSKTYYKFSSDFTGLHRIEYTTLLSSGINLNGANLKLFVRGEQIPIYVSTSGNFGPSDFIEFYGEKNDGYFDTQLFWYASHHGNDDVSLFTDFITYFLVSDPAGSHLRIESAANDISGAGAPQPFFMHVSRKNATTLHHPGEPHTNVGETSIWFADFEKGEGFVGPTAIAGQPTSVVVPTASYYSNGPSPTVNLRTVGRFHSIGAYNDQHIIIKVNNTTYIDDFSQEYEIENYQFNIPSNAIGAATTSIQCEAQNGVESSTGFPYTTKYAPIFATITYPHSFDMEGKRSFLFNAEITTDKYFEINNFVGETAPLVFDLTSKKRLVPVVQNGIYKFKIPYQAGIASTHQIFITNSTNSLAVKEIAPSEISSKNFVNFGLAQNQGQYIIITHPTLRAGATDWVDQYKRYRQTGVLTSTPSYMETNGKTSPVCSFNNIALVDINELYDQFAHGIVRNPLAIRNFLNYAMSSQSPGQWNVAPSHCFLMGKGVKYPAFRYNPNYQPLCLIPTYGHQPSDNMLASPNIFSYQPQIAIGRLPAQTPEEVRSYLAKMVEYEQAFLDAETYCDLAHRGWMKNALFIAKGWGQDELEYLNEFGQQYAATAQGEEAGMNLVATLTDNCNHCSFPSPLFDDYLEGGLNFINYNGHSEGLYWQYDVNAPETYDNEGMYPFILSNSCFVGQIHETSNTSMSEEWVLSDNHGAIAYMATLFLAYPAFLDIFANAFTQNLFVTHYGESIGSSIVQTIEDIYDPNSEGVKVTCLEFTFDGDPATKLYHFDHPEFTLIQGSGVSLPDVTIETTQTGNIAVNLMVLNLGNSFSGNLTIQAVVTGPPGVAPFTTTTNVNVNVDYIAPLTIQIPIQETAWDITGNYTVTVTVDPQNSITEDCNENTNNSASANFTVQGAVATCSSLFQFNNINPVYCNNAAPFVISSNIPANFTVNGTPTNTFSPGNLNGNVTIIANYIDPATGQNCDRSTTVNVVAPPTSTFSILDSNPSDANFENCIDDTFTFTFTGSNANITNFTWNFGTPGTYQIMNQIGQEVFVIKYLTPGSRVVSLYTQNSAGCVSYQTSQTVNVLANVSAPALQCLESSMNSITVSWPAIAGSTFYTVTSSGNPSIITNTYYTVNNLSPGTSVNFSVYASSPLCGASPASTITCTTNSCSNVNIQTSLQQNQNFCVNGSAQTFNVNPIGTTISGLGITDLGNGTFSFNPSVVNAVGTTNISFSYIDNLGCSTSSIVPIILINPIQPIISGSQTICSGQTGVEYQIDNVGLTSFDWLVTGGQIVSGDNTSSIIVDWDENLQTFGTVAVSTLDNNSCASATVSQQVNVNNSNAPTAGFVVDYNGNNDQVLCLGETVAIDNNTISAESYLWQVVEANSGTIVAEYDTQIPDLEFDTPGVYNLLLTAYGCGSTQDEYEILEAYTIVENPDVTLNAASEYACLGDTVSIQSNLTEGSFNWIGDNLLPSTSATVSLVVTEELNVIELEYTNANGCSDASSIVIFVDQSQNVVANFTPGVTGLCPGEDFVINNNSTGGQYTWSITAASTGEPINVTGTDPIIAPTVSDSYYVSLIADGCAGIASFSDTISVEVYSIPEFEILTDSLAVCAGDTITLSVTGLDGSFVWAGNGIQSSTGSAITAIVSDTTEYSVIYTTAEGCVAPQKAITIVTKSLEACTEDPDPVDPIVPKLFPDVITPNGDGANDTWNITALADYPNNKVEIYSRWGALLYESNSPYDNSFDGTIDGKELPKGTYYYIIYFNDSVSKPKTGTITIL